MLRLSPKYLIRVFLAAPIFFSALISLLTIRYTASSVVVPIFLISSALVIGAIEFLYNKFRPLKDQTIILSKTEEEVILLFGFGAILLCFADLYFHGLTLFDSNRHAYASFTPFQFHLRHFSSLIWLLAIFGFFVKNKYIRTLFIVSSFAFPILFLDRNRLLMSAFSIVVMVALGFPLTQKKINKSIMIGSLLAVITVLFGYLGQIRSKDNDFLRVLNQPRLEQLAGIYSPVPEIAVANCDLPDKIPFRVDINTLNPLVLWLTSYISVPVYNLATQYDCNVHTKDVLLAQMIPSYGRTNVNMLIPLATPLLNAGTEFLPFFLAGGLPLSFIILLLAAGSILLVSKYSIYTQNVFALVFLIRLLYCAAFFNFAPQFFIWTTLGLGCVLIFLKVLTGFIEIKRAAIIK